MLYRSPEQQHAEEIAVRIDDEVFYTDCQDHAQRTTVTRLPRQIKNGTWLIGLACNLGDVCCGRGRRA